jgi:hypothetical protein
MCPEERGRAGRWPVRRQLSSAQGTRASGGLAREDHMGILVRNRQGASEARSIFPCEGGEQTVRKRRL